MISKETQSKLLASRILYITEPVSKEYFYFTGILFFSILALINIFLWS